MLKFIVGADQGAKQAENRVKWSGAVNRSCIKNDRTKQEVAEWERSGERGLGLVHFRTSVTLRRVRVRVSGA